jgi:hypothetical protein
VAAVLFHRRWSAASRRQWPPATTKRQPPQRGFTPFLFDLALLFISVVRTSLGASNLPPRLQSLVTFIYITISFGFIKTQCNQCSRSRGCCAAAAAAAAVFPKKPEPSAKLHGEFPLLSSAAWRRIRVSGLMLACMLEENLSSRSLTGCMRAAV